MVAHSVKDSQTHGTRGEQTREIERQLFELDKNPQLESKPKELESRGGAYYSDTACSIISAIYNNRQEIHVVNTLNRGATPDLDENSVVETNAKKIVEVRILWLWSLPVKIRGLIQSVKAFEELTIEAAVTGDYSTALMALSVHPLMPSVDIAEKILDEYLVVNRPFLPQYPQ